MLARKIQYDNYDYQSYYGQQETGAPEAKQAMREVCNTALRRKALAMVVMTLFFAFYMVMRNDAFIQNGYTLVKMKEHEAELVKNIEYTRVNIAKAKSPERITMLAANLGLVHAEQNVYVSTARTEKNQEQATEKEGIAVAWQKWVKKN